MLHIFARSDLCAQFRVLDILSVCSDFAGAAGSQRWKMRKNMLMKMKASRRAIMTKTMRKSRSRRRQGYSRFQLVFYWTDCGYCEQAKKKPTPAKKATAAKKTPSAKKPAKTRDDWIAQGYDGEAVDTAMEARPALDTKQEIWDVMLERFKFWMVLIAGSVADF